MYVLAILGSFMLRDGILEIDRIKKKVIIKKNYILIIGYMDSLLECDSKHPKYMKVL